MEKFVTGNCNRLRYPLKIDTHRSRGTSRTPLKLRSELLCSPFSFQLSTEKHLTTAPIVLIIFTMAKFSLSFLFILIVIATMDVADARFSIDPNNFECDTHNTARGCFRHCQVLGNPRTLPCGWFQDYQGAQGGSRRRGGGYRRRSRPYSSFY